MGSFLTQRRRVRREIMEPGGGRLNARVEHVERMKFLAKNVRPVLPIALQTKSLSFSSKDCAYILIFYLSITLLVLSPILPVGAVVRLLHIIREITPIYAVIN